jgi:Protein of unknown function (DUF2505)
MDGTVRHHYEQSVDRIFALMTNPDFLKRRAEAAGEQNVAVKSDPDGTRLHIRVDRDIERNFPAFMKKVFNPKNHLTDIQAWDTAGDTRSSTWSVEIEGNKRIEIRGRTTLTAGPTGGCDCTESFTVTVHIPLIGGRIEKYVIGETESAIRRQIEFARKELG